LVKSSIWKIYPSYHPHPALPLQARVWEGVKKGNYYTKNKDHKLRVAKAIKPFNYSTTQPFNQDLSYEI